MTAARVRAMRVASDRQSIASAGAVPSGRWPQAINAPSASTAAEHARPPRKPPAPSATQPTRVGPTIWPAANTIVKALMPAGHAAGGALCRTSAVVGNALRSEFGYCSGHAPRDPAYRAALAAELDRMRRFLGLAD